MDANRSVGSVVLLLGGLGRRWSAISSAQEDGLSLDVGSCIVCMYNVGWCMVELISCCC